MARMRYHGGECCGIRHLSGFNGNETFESLKEIIYNRRSSGIRRGRVRGMLVEVVLTKSQMKRMPKVVKALKKLGFKTVSKFCNINSGNICNVMHLNEFSRN